MTRRDALPQVLRGLEALAAQPGVGTIKVNAVALRGFTEEEAIPFAAFAREHPYEVRFIEYMPLDADRTWAPEQVLSGEEIRAASRPSGRSRRSRASRAPPRACGASPTARGRSASSTRSPSRSAGTATGSA
jgi:cyclic pyranopterin phosphate synthase